MTTSRRYMLPCPAHAPGKFRLHFCLACYMVECHLQCHGMRVPVRWMTAAISAWLQNGGGESGCCVLAVPIAPQVQVTLELMLLRLMPEGVLNVDSVVKVCTLWHRESEVTLSICGYMQQILCTYDLHGRSKHGFSARSFYATHVLFEGLWISEQLMATANAGKGLHLRWRRKAQRLAGSAVKMTVPVTVWVKQLLGLLNQSLPACVSTSQSMTASCCASL